MKILVFSIRDSATQSFGNPMFQLARGAFTRDIGDAVNDGKSMLSGHPEDYEIFQLGTFDTDTGLFDTGVPESIGRCKDLVIPPGSR